MIDLIPGKPSASRRIDVVEVIKSGNTWEYQTLLKNASDANDRSRNAFRKDVLERVAALMEEMGISRSTPWNETDSYHRYFAESAIEKFGGVAVLPPNITKAHDDHKRDYRLVDYLKQSAKLQPTAAFRRLKPKMTQGEITSQLAMRKRYITMQMGNTLRPPLLRHWNCQEADWRPPKDRRWKIGEDDLSGEMRSMIAFSTVYKSVCDALRDITKPTETGNFTTSETI